MLTLATNDYKIKLTTKKGELVFAETDPEVIELFLIDLAQGIQGPPGADAPDRFAVTAVASVAGVVTLDYALGDYFALALTENVISWVISNPPSAGKGFSLMVQLTQGAAAYTAVKPGTTAGGAALDVSAAPGAIDLLAISSFDNGATLRSTIAKEFS